MAKTLSPRVFSSRALLSATAAFMLGGCVLGPNYERPATPVPAAFSETGPWREAAPKDLVTRGNWWELFSDPVLNDLQAQSKQGSPQLQVAAARVEQARAVAGITGTYLLPDVNFNPSAQRLGVTGNRPDQPEKVLGNRSYVVNDFRLPIYASYELDFWGKGRRASQSADAQAQAALAAYYTVLITLEGDIAQSYFRLRAYDEELRILRENIELQRRARNLVGARKSGGLSSELDVARVETQLALTQAQAEETARRRAETEHALSVLVGATPEGFKLPERTFDLKAPAIPVGLPSDLLERRPDIAEAERRMIARNAEIGVAKAAYFPSFRLTAGIGYQSLELEDLLNSDSKIWNVGVSVFQPIFNSGRIGFDVDRANAAYQESFGVYRARLLRAFEEVETSLSALRILDQQAQYQAVAVSNAQKATQLAEARFKSGLVIVLEVIDAQRTSLQAQRQALQVANDQMLATVALIKALGGSWHGASTLSNRDGTPAVRSKDGSS